MEEGTNRISLTYRDEASNPWSNITERFQEKTLARGKVTKSMDFGAFVELMPGVEGLVHISELSSKRVNNVGEVVKEGDWVDVYILDIDADNRKMSLSIKQATVAKTPAPESGEEEAENEAPTKPKNTFKGPLKGGTESTGSGKFGLKW
jgi:small subunit ribosomal protein S1